MTNSLRIMNPNNNHELICNIKNKFVNLALIDGLKKYGISVPVKSVLERTPAVDLFMKKAAVDFKPEHFNLITDFVKFNNK